jgi:subtilisin family serine protease
VINMSLQGDDPDPRMKEAIDAAAAANVLVVASAGNSARNIDAQPSFPASVPAPNLIGVAATAPEDGRRLDVNSNYGRLSVQLAAPGEQILSTGKDGDYEYKSGTSMAAPQVTGVAALMAAARPGIAAAELRALLLGHATRSPLAVGSGYLDALGSVLAATASASFQAGQPPVLRILLAAKQRSVTKVQAALLGSAQAVRRYRVSVDGRRVAQLRAGASPFTLTLRRRSGRRLQIDALDARGKRVAGATRAIAGVRRGKRGVAGGRGIGTSGAPVWIG